MPLTDSHCHLDFPQLYEEVDDVIARALTADIHRMISIATTDKSLSKVRLIAENYAPVFYAYGLHPLHVDEQELISAERLGNESQHHKMVGIGETGLDYHYSIKSKTRQIASLEIHIEAAQETGLPLIIHSRNADEDMARILSTAVKSRPFSCVMHCFSSGKDLAYTALDCGFYLSMSGVVTFKNAQDLRDIFRTIPVDRVLIETDAPYLAPIPYRGKRNEPSYIRQTAQMGAEIFGLSFDEFAAQTEHNFDKLFPKAKL